MYLVTKSLKYNRDKIINNLTAVIQSIIAMDTTGTDVLKLQEQIKKIEGKRANLIDLYMSNLINKDEFTATRASCDAEIEELQSIIESVDKQREMIEQQQQLLKEIEDAIKEIVSGVEYEDEFYKHILDKMVVQDKDNIDVYLNLLPMKWSYTVAKASKKAVASEWNISEASLPTEEVLRAVMEYPFVTDLLAFDMPQKAVERVSRHCTALKVLMQRPDALAVVEEAEKDVYAYTGTVEATSLQKQFFPGCLAVIHYVLAEEG